MMFAGWATPLSNLKHEVVQRREEGYLVPDSLCREVDQLSQGVDSDNLARIEPLYRKLQSLPRDPDFCYTEPNDLTEIRKQRPDGPRKLSLALDDDALLDRSHGAWTGRAVGCALGKPSEGVGIFGTETMTGREAIKQALQNTGEYPLNDYFPLGLEVEGGTRMGGPAVRERIAFMPPDDDIHYTLVGLKVLEAHGRDFAWWQVADMWNRSLPYGSICTAETQAIMNYNLRTPRRTEFKRRRDAHTTPEYTSTHNNPYREWIGAQIRADFWGYACAGHPERAAEFAYRDACWTHRANGIYGEMFMAAVIAAAFVEADAMKLIEIGLSEVPQESRFAVEVRKAAAAFDKYDNFDDYVAWVEREYKDTNPIHTINNAIIVLESLYYGKMDTHDAVCIAVMSGYDTDCNGATVGSITGAVHGLKGLGTPLAARLNDTVKPLVLGFQEITFTELAERTLAVHRQIQED